VPVRLKPTCCHAISCRGEFSLAIIASGAVDCAGLQTVMASAGLTSQVTDPLAVPRLAISASKSGGSTQTFRLPTRWLSCSSGGPVVVALIGPVLLNETSIGSSVWSVGREPRAQKRTASGLL